jgi:O-antigen/teichoic acid export membrane protein
MLLTQTFEKRIRGYLKQGRSKKVFYNVLNSFLVKILSTVVTLSLIPISLHYTDAKTYGVWLTLSSVITWVQLFDLGLSNGLANRLAVAFTNNDNKTARQYISVTYSFLIVIATALCAIFLSVSNFINWNKLFNTTIDKSTLVFAVNFAFISLCLTFLLRPVNDLLRAKQKHFMTGIIQVTSNSLALVCLLLFGRFFNSDLTILAIILGGAYPVTLSVFSIFLYRNNYPDLKPKLNLKKFERLREIFGISLKFFIINASGIAILASNNLLISYFINPESVTYYTIAYRLFSIVLIFQAMIVTPLWPAYTEAFTIKDFPWIRTTIRGLNKLNIGLAVGVIALLLICQPIYSMWIGASINIPFEINLLLTLYVIVALYKETYVSLVNGSGKLNLQTAFAIVSIILQLPLAYLLLKVLHLGMWGILSLNIFWVLVGCILWRLQYNVLTSSGRHGKIWD